MANICISTSPIREVMREMSIGDATSFPASRMSVIRSTASQLGIEMDRLYKTRSDRASRTIEVKRVK